MNTYQEGVDCFSAVLATLVENYIAPQLAEERKQEEKKEKRRERIKELKKAREFSVLL